MLAAEELLYRPNERFHAATLSRRGQAGFRGKSTAAGAAFPHSLLLGAAQSSASGSAGYRVSRKATATAPRSAALRVAQSGSRANATGLPLVLGAVARREQYDASLVEQSESMYPMSISERTRKRLWTRANDRCAFPRCGQPLLHPVEGGDEDTIVGKECHNVAQSDDQWRGPNTLTEDEKREWAHLIADRDGYANLVLMCGVHHDIIDDRNQGYSGS